MRPVQKRALSFILAFCVILSILPASAIAQTIDRQEVDQLDVMGDSPDVTSSSIQPNAVSYDSGPGGTIATTLSAGQNTLSQIICSGKTLTAGTDYMVNGTQYTFTESFLATLDVGEHQIIFDCSSGTDPVLTITVAAPTDWTNPFTDVKEADWFYDAVCYVNENGLFSGTSDTTFSPNDVTTRGMLVTALWQQAGAPTVTGTATFTDVAPGAYYERAVIWAVENGIVFGYSESTFGPDDMITREQAAGILARYLQFSDVDIAVTLEYRFFADEDEISDWAKSAIQLMNKLDIITGIGGSTINPQGQATRAEIAVMFQRLAERIK